MHPLLQDFVRILTALFVVVDPLPIAPLFASLTANRSRADVRRIARRASVVGALLLFVFAVFGPLLFRLLRLDLAAFRAAGGLLLLLTAIDMLRAKVSACRCSPAELEGAASQEDISIVPLAIPMLSGPGAIATVMVLASGPASLGKISVLVLAIAIVFLTTYGVLRVAPLLGRLLGTSGLALVQRVMGLVLAAFSIQLITEGVRHLVGFF